VSSNNNTVKTAGNARQKFTGLSRELIAMRVSREIKDGMYVNLGIGIPTLVSDWIEGRDIVLQAEIGMLKTGPLCQEDGQIDHDRINASCQAVTELPGSSFFDIVQSFSMIRGGHIDIAVMGALQVNARGDYAGWLNPSRGLDGVGNIGGSMDLAAGAKKLYIAMEHTTPDNQLKVVDELTYPATTVGRVSMIFTDLAVMEVTPKGLLLREVFAGLTPEDIQSVTEPKLIISPDLKEIEL
jgi:3-oxoacid CoA-transferase subunit B